MPELLAHHTTLRVGGPAREFAVAAIDDDLITTVVKADDANIPVLVMGGGSNLVVADAGFDGIVIKVATRGITVDTPAGSAGRRLLDVAAGEPWDTVVSRSLDEQLAGLECLSGIPGLAGATPIQNVGAYGQEVAASIVGVRAFDRTCRDVVELSPSDCSFGYRISALKGCGRYVILGVRFALSASAGLSEPVRYAELARTLGVDLGDRAPLPAVREAVLRLRRAKGMVLDDSDPDSVSAGSFFTNPIVTGDRVPAGAPRWPMPDGRVKTSAAWLIEHAGFGRGYGIGRAGVSGKHTLALVNRGGATTAELVALARQIRDGVSRAFGIDLVPEPALVGVAL